MKEEKCTHRDQEFSLFKFKNPMTHEKWHQAEDNDLVFIKYVDNGGGYYDDDLYFAKKKDEELARDYFYSWEW